MLIISLILLLLSNSITLRRDKSILYSRATITILLIATLITYDNLLFVGFFFIFLGSILFIIYIYSLVFKCISLIYLFISMEGPKVHSFTYLPLHSASFNNKNALDKLTQNKSECKDDMKEAHAALKSLIDAIKLDKILKDKSKNNSMEKIMSFYEEFFDEDSGNTKEEGLKQLHQELLDDFHHKKKLYEEAKLKLEKSDFNSQSIIPVIFSFNFISPFLNNILPFIALLISTISLILTFGSIFPNIDIYMPDLIFDIRNYIQSIIRYEIIISLPTFIWSCYSLWKKTKRYINIGKRIRDFIYYSNHFEIFISLVLLIIFIITLFIFIPEELLSIANILALILFNR